MIGSSSVFGQRVQAGEQHLGRALLALAHAGGGRVQPCDGVGEAGTALLGEHVADQRFEQLEV